MDPNKLVSISPPIINTTNNPLTSENITTSSNRVIGLGNQNVKQSMLRAQLVAEKVGIESPEIIFVADVFCPPSSSSLKYCYVTEPLFDIKNDSLSHEKSPTIAFYYDGDQQCISSSDKEEKVQTFLDNEEVEQLPQEELDQEALYDQFFDSYVFSTPSESDQAVMIQLAEKINPTHNEEEYESYLYVAAQRADIDVLQALMREEKIKELSFEIVDNTLWQCVPSITCQE